MWNSIHKNTLNCNNIENRYIEYTLYMIILLYML